MPVADRIFDVSTSKEKGGPNFRAAFFARARLLISLENQLRANLDLPRACRAVVLADLHRGFSKVRREEVAVGLLEVDVVEHVVAFKPELQLEAFGDRRRLCRARKSQLSIPGPY